VTSLDSLTRDGGMFYDESVILKNLRLALILNSNLLNAGEWEGERLFDNNND
jgi:hypothetical protein